ncbi:PKD domain-containing protein [Cytophagaceae bacterium ABcell3]|nr:PKD domain-containing protein [Cytophagaceae bacterium ABcell3]
MRRLLSILAVAVSLLLNQQTYGQCPDPQLFDLQLLEASSAPVWVNNIENQSSPDEFTLELYAPEDVHDYTIDFGDGSPIVSGTLWEAGTPIAHTYPLGQYTVTLTETRNGCTTTITGTLINDRKPGASAIPPTDMASGCVPHELTFVNQTTNASPFTRFVWDWGDGNIVHADASTVGESISHIYERGRAGCNMTVKLTAISLSDSSFSTYGPYDMWDLDSTAIEASALELCNGDTITFTDVTLYNCNNSARRIQWDLREVGGELTNWLPNTPQNKVQQAYVDGPVGSTFTVFLADSNICGVRTSSVTVRIVDSPDAEIQPDKEQVCVDEPIVFRNTTSGNVARYRWNFGDNTGWRNTNNSNSMTYAYDEPGVYEVTLVAEVAGSTQCSDTATVQIEVLQSPEANFTPDVREGCNPLEVNIENESTNASTYRWYLDDSLISESEVPEKINLNRPGVYELRLVTANAVGCEDSKSTTLYTYPQITVDAEVEAGCQNHAIEVRDLSSLGPGSNNNNANNCATGNILFEQFDGMGGPHVNMADIANQPPLAENSGLLPELSTGPHNEGDFGARVRGFICPPRSGSYTFWIAADGEAELWLSTDEDPENKSRIAYLNQGVADGDYDRFNSQRSHNIQLTPGQRVYIEILYKKEGFGENHLSVAWRRPGSGDREAPISGEHLAPFSVGGGITQWHWDFGDGIGSSELQNPEYVYADTGEYEITLTASSGRCSDTQSFPITIHPAPEADFSVTDLEGCGTFQTNILNLSRNAEAFRVYWSDTSSYFTPDADWDSLSYEYNNFSDGVKEFNISLVAEGEVGCKDSLTKNVIVHPSPSIDLSHNPVLPQCSPAEIEFAAIGSGFDEYVWKFGRDDTVSTAQRNISHTFSNQSLVLQYDTVRVNGLAPGGCVATAYRVIATYPEVLPEIVIEGDDCSGAELSLSVKGHFTSYQWDLGEGNESTEPNPTQVYYSNNPGAPEEYTVRVQVQNPFGCSGTAEKEVVINPVPTADFEFLDAPEGCSPLTVNIENLSTNVNGEIYSWNLGEGVEDMTEMEFSYTWVNDKLRNDSIPVNLVVQNEYGCADSTSESVVVYYKPKADYEANLTEGCAPLEVAFTNLSSGAERFYWAEGISNPLGNNKDLDYTFRNNSNSSDTISVRLIAVSEYSCRDTTVQEIVIFPTPEAAFEFLQPGQGCTPLVLDIQNMSSNSSDEVFVWNLEGEDMEIETLSFEHIWENAEFTDKEVNVSLYAENRYGCTDSTSESVTIYPRAKAGFDADVVEGCSPLEVNFSNHSEGASEYLWSSNQNPLLGEDSDLSYIFENNTAEAQVIKVELLATTEHACSDTTHMNIEVNPTPQASFEFVQPAQGCTPLVLDIRNMSSNNSGESFMWNLEGEDTEIESLNFDHTWENNEFSDQEVSVRLVVENRYGCTDSTSESVTIYPRAKADFDADVVEGCSPLEVNFSNLSEGASAYLWSSNRNPHLGDNQDLTHVFENNSSEVNELEVVLVATTEHACNDTAYMSIEVSPKPIASFTFLQPSQGCSPLELDIRNNSSSDNDEEYLWDLGAGEEIREGDFSFLWENMGSVEKEVSSILYVTNKFGCSDTASRGVTIFPKPVAAFEADKYEGCEPLEVNFSNLSENASSYLWYDNDNLLDNKEHLMHTFNNAEMSEEIHGVTLIAISDHSCKDTLHQEVTVVKRPVSRFNLSSVNVYAGDTVFIENLSEEGSNYLWDFDNGHTSNEKDPVQYIFTDDGVFDVGLIVANAFCEDSSSNQVTVTKVPPVADFTGGGSGCGSITVTFQNKSSHGSRFIWDFGDGNVIETTSLSAISYTFYNYSVEEKVFNVKLTVVGPGGEAEKIEYEAIVLMPLPEVDFEPRPREVYIPNEVTFVNDTRNAVSYEWDFGDGNVSNQAEPVIAYEEPGEYDVTLTATNEYGCSVTRTLPAAVKAREGGRLVMPNAFTPRVGGSGGNAVGTGLNDVFSPGFFTGVEEYELLIFNKWGSLIFESNDINIGWDGYYDNRLCEEGVYVYKVKVRYINGNVQEILGDVTLLRGN